MRELEQALETTLHTEIPITRQLGISVIAYRAGTLALQAPLDTNINHKRTAFAGSINAIATLAGWGLIWLLLKEADLSAKIVIQESQINYRLPITRDIVATCSVPASEHLARFLTVLRRKGRARLELRTEISEQEQLAVEFTGRYVAFLRETEERV